MAQFHGDTIIQLPIGIFGPGSKAKPGNGHLNVRLIIFEKDRTKIPRPSAVGRNPKELNTGHLDPNFVQHTSGFQFMGLVNEPIQPTGPV